jgi:peptidyl-dipeptidase Dcp
MTNANPLLQSWDTPFGIPPFGRVRPEDFVPALEAAMQAHRNEIDAIATNSDAPTFANTVAAFDRAGRTLVSVELLFHNLCSSETSPALQAAEREMAPRLAAHHNAILLNATLFSRIDRLHTDRASSSLRAEELRLLERIHLDFTLAGARLSAAAKKRLEEIVERLAALTTQFSQNVLADE